MHVSDSDADAPESRDHHELLLHVRTLPGGVPGHLLQGRGLDLVGRVPQLRAPLFGRYEHQTFCC